jgi:hypothetical protein
MSQQGGLRQWLATAVALACMVGCVGSSPSKPADGGAGKDGGGGGSTAGASGTDGGVGAGGPSGTGGASGTAGTAGTTGNPDGSTAGATGQTDGGMDTPTGGTTGNPDGATDTSGDGSGTGGTGTDSGVAGSGGIAGSGAGGSSGADPIPGDWNVTYGSPSVVTMSGTSASYTVTAKTPVQVTGAQCSLPPGTLIATFSGSGTSYSGQHGLWRTSDCSFASFTSMTLTLAGTTLNAVLGTGARLVFTKIATDAGP